MYLQYRFVQMALVVCSAVTLTSQLRADTMFAENFNSGTFGSHLTNQGGNQIVNGRVYTTAAQTSDRNVVATNDSDYATSSKDWTYTLDVENSNATDPCYVRVGIGSAAPAAGTWGDNGMWFYEPTNSLYLSLDMHAATNRVTLLSAGGNGFPTTLATLQTVTATQGTARLKKIGNNLTFGWDQGSTGTFVESTVAISSYSFLSTSSKLFFGVYEGNTTSYADNFSVTSVPEPGTCTLLAMGIFGLLAYAWRKRK